MQQVEAIELSRSHDAFDLIGQRVDIGLQLVAIDVAFIGRDDLAFHLLQQVGHSLGSVPRNSDGRLTKRQAFRDRLEAFDVGFHDFRNGPDGRVVLGAGDPFAGRNLALGFGHRLVDRFQGLQRNHCAVVRQNAGHALLPLVWGALRPLHIPPRAGAVEYVVLTCAVVGHSPGRRAIRSGCPANIDLRS